MEYITYYRVSTDQQSRSGLGLEAQQAQVARFLQERPGTVIAAFQEVESGKVNNRPQLTEALSKARQTGARLLIAKLDRLSRNASFILGLKESGVDFMAADMPDANTLTVGIMALLAQQEREMISARTKAALQARKARGLKLGAALVGVNFTDEGRHRSGRIRREAGRERTKTARAVAMDGRKDGLSLAAIAARLNSYSLRTSRGGLWSARQVLRILSDR